MATNIGPSGTTRKKETDLSPLAGRKSSVCDSCRQRRIRCDYGSPCRQCIDALLDCRRDHVPRKRGPKPGSGKIIKALRAQATASADVSDSEAADLAAPGQGDGSDGLSPALDWGSSGVTTTLFTSPPTMTMPATLPSGSSDAFTTPPTGAVFFGPSPPPPPDPSATYLSLIPRCVELYAEHIYPIMPLLYLPAWRRTVAAAAEKATAMTTTTTPAVQLTAANYPIEPADKNLVYALCALTALHMSGRSIEAEAPAQAATTGSSEEDAASQLNSRPTTAHHDDADLTTPTSSSSWEAAGRFFLAACLAVRRSGAYDMVEQLRLSDVISSFWLSTGFFEIAQSRKSWYYLREALTLALDLGLHDEATYVGLGAREALCRRRVFWILFVTERSYAILRNKPLTITKTPSLPSTRHSYEPPDIHAGFLKLVSAYAPLDESFVGAWNDGSDPRVSAATYVNLQHVLDQPPGFVMGDDARGGEAAGTGKGRRTSPVVTDGGSSGRDGGGGGAMAGAAETAWANNGSYPPSPVSLGVSFTDVVVVATEDSAMTDADHEPDDTVAADAPQRSSSYHHHPASSSAPEPTAIQKADLLVTQQWLRLVVWQASLRGGLLSLRSPHESMRFALPLAIAARTASVLASLPPHAVEVHGMGIFEKIFEIAAGCVAVAAAGEAAAASSSRMALTTTRRGSNGGVGVGLGVVTTPPSSTPSDAGSIARSSSSSPLASSSSFSSSSAHFAALASGSAGAARFRGAVLADPLEFFVRALSASPASRSRFAERLIALAAERPGGLSRGALGPALSVEAGVPEWSGAGEEGEDGVRGGSGDGYADAVKMEVEEDEHMAWNSSQEEYGRDNAQLDRGLTATTDGNGALPHGNFLYSAPVSQPHTPAINGPSSLFDGISTTNTCSDSNALQGVNLGSGAVILGPGATSSAMGLGSNGNGYAFGSDAFSTRDTTNEAMETGDDGMAIGAHQDREAVSRVPRAHNSGFSDFDSEGEFSSPVCYAGEYQWYGYSS